MAHAINLNVDARYVEQAGLFTRLRQSFADRQEFLATYEMLHEPHTPAKVVINEALELARAFSGDEAVRFINGVLDAIRRTLQRA